MAIVLRAAIPSDALAVARIHVRSWQRGYRGLLPDTYLDGLVPEERAVRYTFGNFSAHHPATMVATEGDVIRGFVTTGPSPDAGVGEMLALHVDPAHWRSGIGRVLLAAARERLVRHGFSSAVLWALDGNQRADRFYRADGWQPDGRASAQEVCGLMVNESRYARRL